MPSLKGFLGPLLGVLAYIGMLTLNQVSTSRESYHWPELFIHVVVLVSLVILIFNPRSSFVPAAPSFKKINLGYYFGALLVFVGALYYFNFGQSLTRDDLVQIELSKSFHSYSACGFQSQPYFSCLMTRALDAITPTSDLPFKLLSSLWIFLSFVVFTQILEKLQFTKKIIFLGGLIYLLNPTLLQYAIQIRPIGLSVFLSLVFLDQLLDHLKSSEASQLASRFISHSSVKLFLLTFLFINSVGFQSILFIMCILVASYLHLSGQGIKQKLKALSPIFLAALFFVPIQIQIITTFSPAAGALASPSKASFDAVWTFTTTLTQAWWRSFGPLTLGLFILALLGFRTVSSWARFFIRTAVLYYGFTVFIFSQMIALPFQPKYNLTIWSILLLIALLLFQKIENIKSKIAFYSLLVMQSFFLFYTTPVIENYSIKDQADWVFNQAKKDDFILATCLPYQYNFCFSRIESFKGHHAYKIDNGSGFKLSNFNFTPALIEFVKNQENFQRLVMIVERPAGVQHEKSVVENFRQAGFQVHPAGGEIVLTLSPPFLEKLNRLSALLHQPEFNIKSESLYEWRLTLDLITQNYAQYVVDTFEYLDSNTSKQAHLFVGQQAENEKYFFDEKVFRNE